MSLSDYLLTNLLTLDSSRIKENFDRTVTTDEFLHEETSRTATFTLGSSSSSSSTCSLNAIDDDDEEISHEKTKSDHRLLTHSQSLTLECQRRRPVIQDPYRISPDRQLLDDWMITSTGKTRRELSQAHGFSEEQIAVFEESFSLLDKDGDGSISNGEIRSMMNSLGYSPSEEDISTVISKIDIDGNGSVDFHEFLTLMQRRRSITGGHDCELQQVFNVFDKNRDGFIDRDELSDMLLRLGECLSEDDVIDMIEEADCLDHDGKVSYEEFKAILH